MAEPNAGVAVQYGNSQLHFHSEEDVSSGRLAIEAKIAAAFVPHDDDDPSATDDRAHDGLASAEKDSFRSADEPQVNSCSTAAM